MSVTEQILETSADALVVAEPGHLDTETRDVLRRAKEYLLTHGWRQRSLTGVDGSVCLVGALCGGDPRGMNDHWNAGPRHRAWQALNRLTERLLPERRDNTPADWNDEPGRTQAEVVALFDAALTGQPYPTNPSGS